MTSTTVLPQQFRMFPVFLVPIIDFVPLIKKKEYLKKNVLMSPAQDTAHDGVGFLLPCFQIPGLIHV